MCVPFRKHVPRMSGKCRDVETLLGTMHAKKGGAMSRSKIRVRQHLNADALLKLVHTECEKIPDLCERAVDISVADALKSGFAMFSLKDPSLLAFDQRRHDATKLKNLQRLYHIGRVPCDPKCG